MSFLTSLRPVLTHRSPLLYLKPTTAITASTTTAAITSTTHTHGRAFASSPASRVARMTIVGRLADAPELVPTSGGQDVVRYALATSHGPRDNKQTSWWKVACFLPEGAARERLVGAGRGSLVYVEGDCSMNKFQTKDGTQTSALSIIQRNYEILDRRDARAEGQVEGQVEGESMSG